MNCKQVQNQIVFFIEGQLAADLQKSITQHLRTCSECARLVERQRQLWQAMTQVAPIEPPATLFYRVQRKLQPAPTPPVLPRGNRVRLPRSLTFTPALATLALVIGILIGNFLGKNFYQKISLHESSLVSMNQDTENYHIAVFNAASDAALLNTYFEDAFNSQLSNGNSRLQ